MPLCNETLRLKTPFMLAYRVKWRTVLKATVGERAIETTRKLPIGATRIAKLDLINVSV